MIRDKLEHMCNFFYTNIDDTARHMPLVQDAKFLEEGDLLRGLRGFRNSFPPCMTFAISNDYNNFN